VKRAWLRPTGLKRAIFFITADIALSLLSFYGSYLLRFNFSIPELFFSGFWKAFLLLTGLKITALWLKGQYRIVWRFYGLADAKRMFEAHLFAYGIFVPLFYLLHGVIGPFPRSVVVIDFLFSFVLLIGLRAFKRLAHMQISPHTSPPAVLVGTAPTVDMLVRSATDGTLPYEPLAAVVMDKDYYAGSYIGNVPIYTLATLPDFSEDTETVTAVLGGMDQNRMDRCIDLLASKGVRRFQRLYLQEGQQKKLTDISIEDLLSRPPRDFDPGVVERFIKDKVVLVTGAGGSIGGEICRQLLAFGARQLLMLDHSEYHLYTLHEALDDKRTVPILLSLLERELLEEVLTKYQPQIVVHAAAYKHVPMCEANPSAAIINNIVGAMNLIDLCIEHRVQKVVNISSDKAVRPTSIMGATKRVIELYAHNVPNNQTDIVSVRFGNVLGSSGSVVPKFKAQIEAGGPVTVTHPEMTRYFMLISEACRLVLQAAAIAKGGELFILDMGEPVKIVDLARRMIQLYGKEGEIEIRFTGLRPGEKLYEELLVSDAEMKTKYDTIYVADPGKCDYDFLLKQIIALLRSADQPQEKLQLIVPEYRPQKSA